MKHSHKDIVTILFVCLLLFFAPIESDMETFVCLVFMCTSTRWYVYQKTFFFQNFPTQPPPPLNKFLDPRLYYKSPHYGDLKHQKRSIPINCTFTWINIFFYNQFTKSMNCSGLQYILDFIYKKVMFEMNVNYKFLCHGQCIVQKNALSLTQAPMNNLHCEHDFLKIKSRLYWSPEQFIDFVNWL